MTEKPKSEAEANAKILEDEAIVEPSAPTAKIKPSKQFDDEEDAHEKRRKLMLAGVAGVALLSAVAGGVVWVRSAPTEAKPTEKLHTDVELSDKVDTNKAPSSALAPQTLNMVLQKDGTYTGTAKLSALKEDILVTKIDVTGDQGLTQSNTCDTGHYLKAGTSCDINVFYRPSSSGLGKGTNAPAVNLTAPAPGASATPDGQGYQLTVTVGAKGLTGGAIKTTKLTSLIAGLPANETVSATGANGGLAGAGVPTVDLSNGKAMSGNAGTAQTQAYGPVNANGTAVNGPLNNNGTTVAGGYTADGVTNAGGQQFDAQGQRIMTPRERYILARRESAFNGASAAGARSGGVVSAQNDGSWGSLPIQSAKSSKPQDMSRVLTMDRVITAVLVRTFDSRSSQQVIAQVDRNVYGAAGRNVLIPRGSTVIGTMAAGAERAVVVWSQIIRPDGARFVMRATGGDAMGQAGVPGFTDHRYGKRFGAILMGTALKSGVAIASNASSTATAVPGSSTGITTSQNNGAIVSGIVTQDLNTLVQQILAENSVIKPVTTVPAGTRMTIFPQQDLVLYPVDQKIIVTPDYPRQMNAGAQSSKYSTSDPANQPKGGNNGTGGAPAGQRQPSSAEQAAAASKTFQTTLNPNNMDVSKTVPWQN